MAEESRTRKDFEQELIVRALKDETYRQHLKNNPKAALEEASGQSLPETLNVTVLEESASNLYIVLPPPLPEGSEMSDEQLDAVAGGGWTISTGGPTTITVVT
jgi:hypothetical protein